MLSSGRIIFIAIFLIAFIVYLIWAYRKDIRKNPAYFKGSLKILFVIVGIYAIYFILTRLAM